MAAAAAEISAEAERLIAEIAELDRKSDAVLQGEDIIRHEIAGKEREILVEQHRLLNALVAQHNAAMAEAAEVLEATKAT